MKKFASALLTSTALVFAASSANAALIDDFGGPTNFGPVSADVVEVSAGAADTGVANDSGIDRLLTSINTSNLNDFNVAINQADLGLYTASADVGVTGTTWISYDLTGTDILQELVDGDVNAFSIEVASVDNGAEIGVVLSDGTIGLLGDLAPRQSADFGDNSSGTFFVPVDIGTSTWVSLFIDTAAALAGDVAIDSFGTACVSEGSNGLFEDPAACLPPPPSVSEPGTVGLLGLGLIGVAAAARRRKV